MKLIDVILPIYNEPKEYFIKSIESILNQTYKNIHLIIILDNPDNIDANEYLDNLADNRVEIIKNNKNLGLIKSLNICLKKCLGDYIARMDADDIAELNRLEKQKDYLEQNRLDFIGSNVIWFSDKENLFVSNLPSTNENIVYRSKFINCFYHPTFFFKKEVLDNVQEYPMTNYCEDLSFSLKVIIEGYKVGNTPECLVKYRFNPFGITNTKLAEQRLNSSFVRKKIHKVDDISYALKKYEESKKYRMKVERLKKYFIKKNLLLNKKKNIFKKIFSYSKCFLISPTNFIYDLFVRFVLKPVRRL